MQSTDESSDLLALFDVLYLDLDGVVYRSDDAVEFAVDSLNLASKRGTTLRFLTNNASRTPTQISRKLQGFGLVVDETSVITSAMAITQVMAAELLPGSSIFVVGHEGLEAAVSEVGLCPTRDAKNGVSAVVQGHSPDTAWHQLADAGYLIASGVPWYASNTDATVPTNRGLAPGNGAFVRVLEDLTGRKPIVAGKPHSPLFTSAQASASGKALMIGDRLDTDIQGANGLGIASAWVHTGVHGINDLVNAHPRSRPAYILSDLASLFRPQRPVTIEDNLAVCGSAVAQVEDKHITLSHKSQTPEDELRAVISLGWHLRDVAGELGELNATLNV